MRDGNGSGDGDGDGDEGEDAGQIMTRHFHLPAELVELVELSSLSRGAVESWLG